MEYLNSGDYEKSVKYFKKASKVTVPDDFDEQIEIVLTSYWKEYIADDLFKDKILTEEAETVVNDIRAAFREVIPDGIDSIYNIFISDIHYFRGEIFKNEGSENNMLAAIDEYSAVLENDEKYYSSAQQELIWLEQERNRLIVKYSSDVEAAAENSDLKKAKEFLSKIEIIDSEDDKAQFEQLKDKVEKAETEELNKQKKISERKQSVSTAEAAAMELNVTTAGTILGAHFQQVLTANCVGYLLNENIFLYMLSI